MLLDTRDQFLRQLCDHQPADPQEGLALAGLVDLLESHPNPFTRSAFDPGHITASALLLDARGQHMAFVWHEKLGRHLEPGGHCETDDHSVSSASWRELLEETAVPAHAVRRLKDTPVDVDVHDIPAHGSEGPHQHFDVRYAYQLTTDVDLPLVTWLPLQDVMQHEEAGLRRCARKLSRLKPTFAAS